MDEERTIKEISSDIAASFGLYSKCPVPRQQQHDRKGILLRDLQGISWLMGNILGRLPFSVAELLLPVLALGLVYCLVLWVIKLIRHKGKRWSIFGAGVLNILLAVSLLYFSFVVLWGLNYNRESLGNILGLEVRPSSFEELVEVTEDLLAKTNSLREKVVENEAGVMVPLEGQGAFQGKEGLCGSRSVYPGFDSVYGRPKPLYFHLLLPTRISGVSTVPLRLNPMSI